MSDAYMKLLEIQTEQWLSGADWRHVESLAHARMECRRMTRSDVHTVLAGSEKCRINCLNAPMSHGGRLRR
jgi:hypothetical protein